MKTPTHIFLAGAMCALCVACIDENKQAVNDSANDAVSMETGGSTTGASGGVMTAGMPVPAPAGGVANPEPMAGLPTGGIPTPEPAPPPNCGNEDDLAPNQDRENAAEVEVGFDRNDLFRCPNTSDWYVLNLMAGRKVRVALTPDPAEARYQLELLNENGGQLNSGRRQGDLIAVDYTSPMDQKVFLRIGARGDTTGYYALAISGDCRLDADCGEGKVCNRFEGVCEALPDRMCGLDPNEPNNTDATATPLEAPVTALGGVLCAADRDWFAFVANDGDSFEMLISFPEGEDLDAFVINAQTGQVIERAVADRDTNPERLEFSYLPAGEYRVGISAYFGAGDQERDVAYTVDFVGRSGACQADRECIGDGLPLCVDGVCQPARSGANLGERCSGAEDCGPDAELCYTGGEGGHDNFCTVNCRSDEACSGLGEGAQCVQIGRQQAVCFPGCQSDNDCSAFRRCDGGQCVLRGACRVDADCQDGAVCRTTTNSGRFCGLPAPDSQCGLDMDNDPNNTRTDATEIQLGQTQEGLKICNDDDDWYRIAIPADAAGRRLDVTVSFREGVDIDVYVYDEAGNRVGQATSADNLTETAAIDFISSGQYYIRVDQYSSDRLEDTIYSLTTSIGDEAFSCTPDGNECAETRPLRMVCDVMTGGCVSLEGGGEVELGQLCDSSDDCRPGDNVQTFCWPPASVQQGPNIEELRWVGSNICTHGCQDSNDCADVEGTECVILNRRGNGVCLPPENR